MPTAITSSFSARRGGARRRAGLLLGAAASGMVASVSACTYGEIPFPGADGTKSYMIARSMEFGQIMGNFSGYEIDLVPATVSGGAFAYVGIMNVLKFAGFDLYKVPSEGMNEKGLTVSALVLRESIYQERDQGNETTTINLLQVVPALLSKCDSVKAALELLSQVRVVYPSMIPHGEGLHWAITDPSGRSVVVEYLQGKRVVYENGPRVLTNDPPLDWQWRNLNTYVNLQPSYPDQNSILSVDTEVGKVPQPIGLGWNLFGLPGDNSPPSRFVRMFYLRGYSNHKSPPENEAKAIVLGTALLNNMFVPYGSAANPRFALVGPDYTQWNVLKCAQSKKLWIRGYENMQWRLIDLNRLDLLTPKSWPLEDGTLGIKDITTAGGGAIITENLKSAALSLEPETHVV